MIRQLWSVIPKGFRCGTIGVVVTIFLRAVLNFVGVATLLPVLLLVVDGGSLDPTNYLYDVYKSLNCNTYAQFVIVVCVAVVVVIIIKNIVNLLLYRYERDYIFNLYKYLSEQLYRTYFGRGFSFIKQSNTATLTRNINGVSLTFVAGVLKPLASIVSEGILLLLITAMLALFYPFAALIVCVIFAPIAILFYMFMRKRLHDIGEEENDLQRRKNRIVAETFRGYVDIEMAGAFDHILKRFSHAMDDIVALRKRHATLAMQPQLFSEVGLTVGLVVLVMIATLYGNHDVVLLFGVFAISAVRLVPSLRSIMASWSSIRFNRYTIDILCDVDTIEDESSSTVESVAFNRTIELRNVSFRYDDSEDMVIDNISLVINRGECIGIRGSSGVGKTTLFNIMLGLHSPTSGGVYIDDEILGVHNIKSWHSQVGYVSQSVFIADVSLAENIALGVDRGDIDYSRIQEILKLVNLDDFVASLPNGLESRIGEQGCRISGGQRQRIGIARALYKGADTLFFDEATSSLDSKTEESINEAIRLLATNNRKLTIVIIAHRESSLECCNRIITME